METYPLSSGMLEDSYRSLVTDTPELTLNEGILAQKISKRLDVSPNVTVVDLGAMMATSLIVLGTHFRSEVETGRLNLIATNKQEVGIDDLLDEASRRLNHSSNSFFSQHRILPDALTVDFVQRNHHLVQYVAQVDSANLEKAVPVADIIHERSGGFRFASIIIEALQSVSRTLKMSGEIMTTEYLHGADFIRTKMNDLGIFHQPTYYLTKYLFYKKG